MDIKPFRKKPIRVSGRNISENTILPIPQASLSEKNSSLPNIIIIKIENIAVIISFTSDPIITVSAVFFRPTVFCFV